MVSTKDTEDHLMLGHLDAPESQKKSFEYQKQASTSRLENLKPSLGKVMLEGGNMN